MAYDEGLAERIRGVLADRKDVSEKKMFGGIAFMVRGHMAVGIVKDDLMVRVGLEAHDELVRQPHARPMDFTGRPMKGFLYVDAAGLEGDVDLERWLGHGLQHALSLPAKGVAEGRGPRLKASPVKRRPAKRPRKR
jgi:TfoX/Sxy family transcriptional regulator of competence genes